MGKLFWVVAIASFLLVNEFTVNLLVLTFPAGFGIEEALARVFRHLTFSDYVFTSSFRLIPYGFLLILVFHPPYKVDSKHKLIIWFALAGLVIGEFSGYWNMHSHIYTGEHLSSTAALDLIFTPIGSIFTAAIAGVVGYFVAWAIQSFQTRAR